MKLAVLLIPIMTVSCASQPTQQSASVRDATTDMVKNCQYLGLVTSGFTGGGILLRDTARQSVLNDLYIKASERGGTHIVHKSLDNGWFASNASADAYRCP